MTTPQDKSQLGVVACLSVKVTRQRGTPDWTRARGIPSPSSMEHGLKEISVVFSSNRHYRNPESTRQSAHPAQPA